MWAGIIMSHAQMAGIVRCEKPISAGFVQNVADDLFCYGHSESLKIQSLPTDTEKLRKALEN